MGCWSFGGGSYWGEQNQKDVEKIVHEAIEKGINFFDTARVYNEGKSERSLGEALKGRRGKAIICSKVSPAKAYTKELKRECEKSLKSLKTDYIDIYMLHWPINAVSIRHFTDNESTVAEPPTNLEAFKALTDLKEEGKIREIGISNFGVGQMSEVLDICPGVAVNEMPYNIISRAIEADIVPFCMKNNIKITTSMTLQQGILAGIYSSADDIPPHQAHSRHFPQRRGGSHARHFEEGAEKEIFELLKSLREMAKELSISVAQLSTAWVLSKKWVASALIGSRNEFELNENINAALLSLPEEKIMKIDEQSAKVLDKLGNNPDYYESSKNSRVF